MLSDENLSLVTEQRNLWSSVELLSLWLSVCHQFDVLVLVLVLVHIVMLPQGKSNTALREQKLLSVLINIQPGTVLLSLIFVLFHWSSRVFFCLVLFEFASLLLSCASRVMTMSRFLAFFLAHGVHALHIFVF